MASRQKTIVLILVTVFVAGSGQALHTGVGVMQMDRAMSPLQDAHAMLRSRTIRLP